MKQSKSNEQEHTARSAGRPPAGNEPKLQQIAIGKRCRVVVNGMLQIARDMEYLHSRKIYHGDLNQSNVLVRTRHGDSPLHVKVAGFGQSGAAMVAGRREVARKTGRAGVYARDASPLIFHAWGRVFPSAKRSEGGLGVVGDVFLSILQKIKNWKIGLGTLVDCSYVLQTTL